MEYGFNKDSRAVRGGICIEVVDPGNSNHHCAVGKILIGDFSERFEIALDWWNISNYIDQWRMALSRLNHDKQSCLVASINSPRYKYINWWLLYKKNGKIYVQNQIIVDDIYQEMIGNKAFTPETCYDFIPPYQTHDEDGEKIAEWVIND